MKAFLGALVLGAGVVFGGCASPPPPNVAPEVDGREAAPVASEKEGPAKDAKIKPVMRDNTGVTVREDPNTGTQELFVNPFPEDDGEKAPKKH